MSATPDDHSVTRIHTFADDVEATRGDTPAIVPDPATTVPAEPETEIPAKSEPAPVVPPAAPLPPEEIVPITTRSAAAYLTDIANEPEPTPTPSEIPDTTSTADTPAIPSTTVPAPRVTAPAAPPVTNTLSSELTVVAERAPKRSILADEDHYDSAGEGSGTIIADKRHRRRGFGFAFLSLIKGWGHDLYELIERLRPKPDTVSEGDARNAPGVAVAPNDDFKAVAQERARTVKEIPLVPATAANIKPATETPLGWTHLLDESATVVNPIVPEPVTPAAEIGLQSEALTSNDPGARALAGGALWSTPTKRVAVSKPVTAPPVVPPPAPTPVLPEIVVPAPTPTPPEAALVPTPAVPAAVTPTWSSASTPIPAAEQTVPPPKPTPVIEKIPTPIPTAAEPVPEPAPAFNFKPLEVREQSRPLLALPTNLLLLLLVIGCGTFGLGILLLMYAWLPATNPDQDSGALPLVTHEQEVTVSFSTERAAFFEDLGGAIAEHSGITEVDPVILDTEGVEQHVGAATLIDTLYPSVSRSFKDTITNIALGGVGAEKPFIIMRVSDFDTAFAGMLAWEKTLSVNLAPLFGEPVSQTANPQAATGGTQPALYVDGIVANRSARILYDEIGLERIVYVFVDQRTLLIARDRSTIEQVVPQVR